MSKDPMKLIEEYLERVKVYLPLASDDLLIEMRTHLIEEAEAVGGGRMTAGSALMAIERMGDPKAAANEYAGTGKKVGPVPSEYTQPVLRILGVLVGFGIAFSVAAYVIGTAILIPFGIIASVENWPFSLPIMIFVNVIFVVLIIGGITFADREKMPSEKTVLESFFGIGTEGFKPKARSDAAGELVFGVGFGFVLLLPQLQILYSSAFAPCVGAVAGLVFVGALKGALFLVAGENNVNLIFEAGLGVVWILFSTVLINVGFPLEYAWVNNNGTWSLFNLTEFFVQNEIPFIPFDWIWMFVIFMIVVTSAWRLIVASIKVPMYLNRGRGLWWQGDLSKRSSKRPRGRTKLASSQNQNYRVYHDGYQESED
jgi:hypothetical protein